MDTGGSAGRSDLALSLLAVGATVAAFGPFALLGVDAHHDGVMLKPALDVLSGQTVFRDTFSQYGAGLPYLQAATLWMFGATLPVMRLSAVAVYALTAGVLVSAWRMLLPRGPTLLALGVWLLLPGFYSQYFVLLAWSSVYALLFQALALRSLLRAVFNIRPALNGVLSGVACALVFACRQPVGAVSSVAIVAAFLWAWWMGPHREGARRALGGCLAGMGAAYAVGLLALSGAAVLGDWYVQTIDWPRRWAAGDASGWRRAGILGILLPSPQYYLPWLVLGAAVLFPFGPLGERLRRHRNAVLVLYLLLLAGAAYVIWQYPLIRAGAPFWYMAGFPALLLLFALATAARTLWRRGAVDPIEVASLGAALVGLVSWLQYFPAFCPMHAFWSLTPGVGVCVYAAWRAAGRRTTITALVTILLLLPLAHWQIVGARTKLELPYVRLAGLPPLEGIWLPASEASTWQSLIDAIRAQLAERPEAPMLVEGPDALVATLVRNHRNPGPFYVIWPAFQFDLGSERARFVTAERPLLFAERHISPAVGEAIAGNGYRLTYQGPLGTLFAPAIVTSRE
jgi:hypothetical protein